MFVVWRCVCLCVWERERVCSLCVSVSLCLLFVFRKVLQCQVGWWREEEGVDCWEEASNGRSPVHVRKSFKEKCHRNVKCTSTKTRLLSEGQWTVSPPRLHLPCGLVWVSPSGHSDPDKHCLPSTEKHTCIPQTGEGRGRGLLDNGVWAPFASGLLYNPKQQRKLLLSRRLADLSDQTFLNPLWLTYLGLLAFLSS